MDSNRYMNPKIHRGKFPNIIPPAASALTKPLFRRPTAVRTMLTITAGTNRKNITTFRGADHPNTKADSEKIPARFERSPKKRNRTSTILRLTLGRYHSAQPTDLEIACHA